jgi:hypothetical protein
VVILRHGVARRGTARPGEARLGKARNSPERRAHFKTRGMGMEAIKNKSVSFWPYRRAVILLYLENVISREKFIKLWRSVYGKD